ncbi:TetR/AcrR family transcriptional regulator [Kutzneria sp. CA-103260]|uniref:TetR/AcrR family transcriptional regulator n=1 Tax=Kutzneria sp. CA-103260 TaxID=2802641 RepID=UPI001BAADB84|nr:TetR/AcrR family transcriptional regulator C-terminal domain-containing protein [Kutzneria sp. CA-103260]
MAKKTQRRADGLSREVIIRTAVDLLDSGGENALTLRTLTTRLSTGYGAIYHHVADKGDLLAAATDDVLSRVMAGVITDAEPRDSLRAIALGLFDAIDAHPWGGAQLAREPWLPALLQVYERVGRLLDTLGVPEPSLFDAAGALLNYVLGVAGQNATNTRTPASRSAALSAVAARWSQLDPAQFPFMHKAATQVRDHDDRAQFLAGIDIFLAGIATLG